MDDPPVSAFRALALQTTTQAVNGLGQAQAREVIQAAIARVGRQIGAAVAWYGDDLLLVVLAEYAFTGFPMGETVDQWAALAALAPDGPEYEKLGAIAQRHGIFLAVNAYETDVHYPGLYFQASVVLAPSGQAVLRYRRLHSMFTPSPYDVWDSYLDHYGMDAVLPVARTPIGNLAAIASEEIAYPELARALALRGAEVFVHSTSEATSPDPTPKELARRSRAVENLAAVVSANSGGLRAVAMPGDSVNGHSEIVDYRGHCLARAGAGESLVAAAEIDLPGLRRERLRPSMSNLPARFKAALWAQEFGRHDVERPNGLTGVAADRPFFARRQRETIARLRSAGVLT